MIQRIQTIYLFLAANVSALLPMIFPLWVENNQKIMAESKIEFLSLFAVVAILSFASLLLFKKRKLQMKMNLLNIVLNFSLIGLSVYHLLNLPGGVLTSEKGIGLVTPFIVLVLVFLAQKNIKKDEALVKSVDRIR